MWQHYNSAIVLLEANSREMKTYIHTNTYTWMFMTTLFVIAKSGNYLDVQQVNCGTSIPQNTTPQ